MKFFYMILKASDLVISVLHIVIVALFTVTSNSAREMSTKLQKFLIFDVLSLVTSAAKKED